MSDAFTSPPWRARLFAAVAAEFRPGRLPRSLLAGTALYLLQVIILVAFASYIFHGDLAEQIGYGIGYLLVGSALLGALAATFSSYRLGPRVGLIGGGLLWHLWHVPLVLVVSSVSLEPLPMALNIVALALGSICTFTYLVYVYAKTGSIWITSLAHITMNNASQSLSYFVIAQDALWANLRRCWRWSSAGSSGAASSKSSRARSAHRDHCSRDRRSRSAFAARHSNAPAEIDSTGACWLCDICVGAIRRRVRRAGARAALAVDGAGCAPSPWNMAQCGRARLRRARRPPARAAVRRAARALASPV